VIDRGRRNVIGIRIDAVDYDLAVDRIVRAARERRPAAVSALAVHGVMTGVLDRAHRYRLNSLDLVVPDGQPVRWALNWLHGADLSDRVYGPTLMLRLCERLAEEGLPIFLYGSTPEQLLRLQERLMGRFPALRIAGIEPSRFRQLTADEQRETAARIRASGAALTFVGLGCPRQEVWVFEMRRLVGMPLIAVGAAFSFHAGLLPQAPPLMQAWGLEWLFRLVQEPERLWRRYLLLNPLYLFLLALQGSGLRRFDPDDGVMPAEELRYG
jgi:exopolysaccharide biosynthesis WecB/TagA/CpsF family protein